MATTQFDEANIVREEYYIPMLVRVEVRSILYILY
jgi:hypothetical protein